MKRWIVAAALVLLMLIAIVYADTQTRFRYEKRVNAAGAYYVEIYEERNQDLDSVQNPQPYYTTVHRETKFLDKQVKIDQLTAERAALLAQAQDLQSRITAIGALP